MAEYERHQPEQTLLHEVVREQLESFLSSASEQGAPIARFVERELRAYLDCGILARGFLRLHCGACGRDRLLAFSCKGRGLCPSCGGRRMADTAAYLVDCVLPEVPVRQWVLTLPYPLRYRCAWDAQLTSEVLRAFMRALFADQRRRARTHLGVQQAQCGSVTAIQRFGSALNTNPHFHSILLDGVYGGPPHAPGPFIPLPPPTLEDITRVVAGTARRVMRLLEKRGLENEDDSLTADDPLLATLRAASVRSRIATGPEAGQPWRRLGDRVDPVELEEGGADAATAAPERCVREGGMSLHADVSVPARDRRRLERLARYALRPPVCLDRLEAQPDGRLSYKLKTQWRDGTTHILMERRELLERLSPLIPPPRAHQVRFHGILAPCASGRDQVVPGARLEANTASASDGPRKAACGIDRTLTCRSPGAEIRPTASIAAPEGSPRAGTEVAPSTSQEAQTAQAPGPAQQKAPRSASSARPRRLPWADLLKRVFGVEALRCECGHPMRVIAAITEPVVARRILECMSLPPRAPPLEPARTSGFAADLWPEETGAEGFDQSPPDDWAPGS
ncbi:MAG: IS91 family transposase [bacterium]|nr:IS91 family transposase [bacterium]